MLAKIEGDAIEIIKEAYDMWIRINDTDIWCRENKTLSDYFFNKGLTYESDIMIPTMWDLKDLVSEICIDNNYHTVWYCGCPILRSEFVDCLDSIITMEKMEFLNSDLYIENQAQTILLNELL